VTGRLPPLEKGRVGERIDVISREIIGLSGNPLPSPLPFRERGYGFSSPMASRPLLVNEERGFFVSRRLSCAPLSVAKLPVALLFVLCQFGHCD